MTGDARTIYQGHLDVVSEALWQGDVARVGGMMSYPHRMVYGVREETVFSPEEMERTVTEARLRLLEAGATAYHRVCISAKFDVSSTSRIIGSHTTFVLSGGRLLVQPYQGRMILMRTEGRWLGTGIVTEVDPTALNRFDRKAVRPSPVAPS